MIADTKRHIIDVAVAYRTSLFILAVVAGVGMAFGTHLNSEVEAVLALHRVYNTSPHYEVRLVPANWPTR